ncbi:MAG: histidine phosphatase family protein [Deltaproteobacteria bacterium]
MKTRILLIRHGETDWTKRKKYCGSNDVPLNATGRKQAAGLARRFKDAKVDRIYCSNKHRCTSVAQKVFPGRMLEIRSALREMNFGIFEGMDHDTLLQRFPRLYSLWLKRFGSVTPPKGESFKTFERRVKKVFKEIVAENKGKTCAVVTHGGVMMVIFASIAGRDKIWKFLPSLASVSTVEVDGRKCKIKVFNDTSHL